MVVAGVLALLVALSALVVLLGIRFEVGPLRPIVVSTGSDVLGRAIAIDGSLALVPTLWPTLEVEDFRILNPDGFEATDFVRAGRLRASIGLIPLLFGGEIRVKQVIAEDVHVGLAVTSEGRVNWEFDIAASPEESDAPVAPGDETDPIFVVFVELREIILRDIELTLDDARSAEHFRYVLRELVGRAVEGEPMNLEGRGDLLHEAFRISFDGGTFGRLLKDPLHWPLELEFEVAGTKVGVSRVVRRTPEGELLADVPVAAGEEPWQASFFVEGERLDSLEGLIGVALPPWGPYRVAGALRLVEPGHYRAALDIRVEDSDLRGVADLAGLGGRPDVNVSLSSETVDLEDFDHGDWTPGKGDVHALEDPSETETDAPPDGSRLRSVLSPSVLRSLDLRLSIDIDRVVSGRDELGRGNLELELADGRLAVDPVSIDLPGGSFRSAFAFEPSAKDFAVEVRMDVDRLDYGVLARRIDPETDIGGLLGLRVDLRSRTPAMDKILENANGILDFAIRPDQLEADLFDLWAVNLMQAVIPSVSGGPRSVVNCVVVRLDVEDGRMSDKALLLDTTQMQVKGETRVDYHTDEVYLRLVPDAKEPQFFSLSTPIEVSGHFDDFELGVSFGDLLGTIARVLTGIVVVPIERLVMGSVPADGDAACAAAWQRGS